MTHTIDLPELSLVVLVGVSSSGKTSFAKQHFLGTEVLSSDACRGLVDDDEGSLAATDDAFEVLHFIAGKRLARGRLTVVDATNLKREDRAQLVRLARAHHVLPVAIVLDLPMRILADRHEARADRSFRREVLQRQQALLRRGLRGLKREGFRGIHRLSTPEEVESVQIRRVPMWTDKRHLTGPFDIIGDVHGCKAELEALLGELGYAEGDEGYAHPRRTAVFLGDLVDRGPDSLGVLELVARMVEAGAAICVPGNHDVKFLKWLRGKKVKLRHGLERTVLEVERLDEEDRTRRQPAWERFIDGLVSHYVLDEGRLVVAHAGMKAAYQGRGSGHVRNFALYGETDGEVDAYGLPIRHDWASEYRGRAMVVYGHTPVPKAEWLNNTICVDTGCVFGGALTALRYPERELVHVPAAEVYMAPVKPLSAPPADDRTAQQSKDDLLDLEDVLGKRRVDTQLMGAITVPEAHARAALEVVSRFAVHPKWLVYLPPTMSPCETHAGEDALEHPQEAFEYFRGQGVEAVVCEKKHMGSRAVVVVCRDSDAARRRFGIETQARGTIFTRTGRRFFSDSSLEQALLSRLNDALDSAGLYAALQTNFFVLDCELMPWSAKAKDLVRGQYAAVGASAARASEAERAALEAAAQRGLQVQSLLERAVARGASTEAFRRAYRQYCWPVTGLDDYRLAPFHLLASAGRVHTDEDHRWHMQTLAKLADHDPLFVATPFRVVDLADAGAVNEATEWWREMTARGEEGMVVKPLEFVVRGPRGLVQPAVKVRGPEYLRIIYGPDYLAPENLERLRKRGLRRKRSLALREFALGLEGLTRFAAQEPLRRVHECAFGVLALESEPVDPRL